MSQIFITNPNIKSQLKEANIEYGISVGRRQPMHIVHIDCLLEIAEAGLTPVIIMGSINKPDSKFYDQTNNPLDEKMMRMQIIAACKIHKINDYILLALEDVGNMEKWVKSLAELLTDNDIAPEKSVFHFRKKRSDIEKAEKEIKSLSSYQQELLKNSISVWESHNQDERFDMISSTFLRSINLLDADNQAIASEILAAPEFVLQLAREGKI